MLVATAVCLVSCLEDHTETIRLEHGMEDSQDNSKDLLATQNPEIGSSNTNVPNVNYTLENKDGAPEDVVVRMDMTGIAIPGTSEWLRLIGTGESGQNLWVSVDCQPKFVEVYNTIDDADENVVVKNDIVFLVDNSGTMSDEADGLARDLAAWAKSLTTTYDMKFACIGYNGLITGALNFTSYTDLYNYLNRTTGTNRTVGFAGSDGSSLSSKKSSYDLTSQEECPMAALRFADNYLSFRRDANRIYVNFTDEPNQPAGKSNFSVTYLSSQTNWPTNKGTIHTVYSGSTSITESTNYTEKPWRMSEYTGGTILYTNGSFSGVSLQSLPVTAAIQNSYIIRFSNIAKFMDGKYHKVKVTIYAEDGSVRAERNFNMYFGG